MAQFDVFRNPRGGAYPLLLDVQADLLERLATRVVVPLMTVKRFGAKPITRLNPTVTVRGIEYVLVFQELASVPSSAIGERVASLANRRVDLIRAIDLLFTGS
jgi:toxin CcdB